MNNNFGKPVTKAFKNKEDLRPVFTGGKVSEQLATFGTHVGKHDLDKPKELRERAEVMIFKCECWIKNWKSVIEMIQPEVDKANAENIEKTIHDLKGHSPEQLRKILEGIGVELPNEMASTQPVVS